MELFACLLRLNSLQNQNAGRPGRSPITRTPKQDITMVKLIFAGIVILLVVAGVFTAFQYFIISFLKGREKEDEE